jgi:TonB family protein
MFTATLAEPRRPIAQALQSTFVHASLIAGAVWGTRTTLPPPTNDPTEVSIAWLTPIPARTAGTTTSVALPGIPVLRIPEIPVIPVTDPSIDLPGTTRVDPRTLTTDLPPGTTILPGGDPGHATTILREDEVDELPSLIVPGQLRYPEVLAEAGITGSVTLSFVIDLQGRVESEGIQVVASTHSGFVAAAKEAVLTSRFRPARKGGEAVRVRVRQTVTFRK